MVQSWLWRTFGGRNRHFEKRVHENQGQPKQHRHRVTSSTPAEHHDRAAMAGEYPFGYRQGSRGCGRANARHRRRVGSQAALDFGSTRKAEVRTRGRVGEPQRGAAC
jgi:hypothetical protein